MKPTPAALHQLAAMIDARLHQFEEIPLNTDGDGYAIGCCSDSMSGPTLYVSGRKDARIMDLPPEGTAKIKYKLRSKSVNYRADGTERYSTDIEVQSIDAATAKNKELAAALEGVTEFGIHDFGDRARDTGGRFAPGQDVSVDEMADAYVNRSKKKKAVLAGVAAGGLATALVGRKLAPGAGQAMGRLVRGVM